MNRLAEMGAKAAVPGINQEHVKSLKIVIPPQDELKQFDCLCSDFFRRALELMAQTIVLSKIRDELLPRLVDGTTRFLKIEV